MWLQKKSSIPQYRKPPRPPPLIVLRCFKLKKKDHFHRHTLKYIFSNEMLRNIDDRDNDNYDIKIIGLLGRN